MAPANQEVITPRDVFLQGGAGQGSVRTTFLLKNYDLHIALRVCFICY